MATATAQSNPVSDLLFDWVTVLHSKAEGLSAYEKYIKDAQAQNATECVELLRKLHDQDAQQVQQVKDHLAKMMSKSK